MALDQAHQQLSALVKGDREAVGLKAAPRRWMVAGPEISRMIQEFECHSINSLTSHHDPSHNSQVTFKRDVEAIVDAFCDLGKPFLEDSGDLTLDTKGIMDEEKVMSIRNAYNTGWEQYILFVQEHLHDQKKNISDPIKEQTTLFQKDPEQNGPSSCCSERRLFGRRLWCKSNPGRWSVSNNFRHENQPWPPSLSKYVYREIGVGTESDILQCLEALYPKQ